MAMFNSYVSLPEGIHFMKYQLGTFANVRQGYVRDPSNKDYPMNPKVVTVFGYWCCYSAAIPQTGFLALGLP